MTFYSHLMLKPVMHYHMVMEVKILKTTDGGNSWTIIDTGISEELYEISFPTPQVGYIVCIS